MRTLLNLWLRLLATTLVACQFSYPDSSAANSFRDGDGFVALWTVPFVTRSLQLFCNSSSPVANFTIPPGPDEYTVNLTFGAQPRCYLQIAQGPALFTSIIFSIAPKPNGPPLIWDPSLAVDAADIARGPEITAVPVTVLPVSKPLPSALPAGRPDITLPTDGPVGQSYLAGNYDCLDLGNDPIPECWAVLSMNDWLNAWYLNTPQCGSNPPSIATCNNVPEPWTVTFLREVAGKTGPDCFDIGQDCSVDFPNLTGQDTAPLLTARYYYATISIVNIAHFFTSWDLAMADACQQASDSIPGIIELVDPEKKTHVFLNWILTVLGLGLSLIPDVGPGFDLIEGISADFINGITKGIQKIPDIAKAIWPTGTANSQNYQIDQLVNQLDGVNGIKDALHGNFYNALQIVQGLNAANVSAFTAFTSNGMFSQPGWKAPAVIAVTPGEQTLLLQAFTTFVISTALAQNGWRALMLPGVEPSGIDRGTAQCPIWATDACKKFRDIGCEGGYDTYNQCNDYYWWYGNATNSSYTIVKNGKTTTDATNILNTIFTQGWSTGTLLFESAAICELQNVFPNTSNPIYSAVNGIPGFTYANSYPPADPFATVINSSTNFLPMNGEGFVNMSESESTFSLMYHPTGANLFSFSPEGVDLKCTSQLNTSVANEWKKKNWVGNNP